MEEDGSEKRVYKKSGRCLGVPFLSGKDSCQPRKRASHIWGASSCTEGQEREKNAVGKL